MPTYIILPSKRFQKAMKKHLKGGQKHLLGIATEVIDLLALHDDRSLLILGTKWRDHELKGNKKGIRELHLDHNILLLYVLDKTQSVVQLLDIVNHRELNKQ